MIPSGAIVSLGRFGYKGVTWRSTPEQIDERTVPGIDVPGLYAMLEMVFDGA